MIRVLFLMLSVLMASTAMAQQAYPALFSVVGVADDDVLNIRSGPSADTDIVGALGPHRREVEVTGQNDDGTWLRVNIDERSGWVAARFMAADPTGDYAFGRSLNCFGTEPFWSLDMIQGTSTTFSRIDAAPLSFGAGLIGRGEGRPDRHIVGFGEGLIVLSQRSCSDGMSDRAFALDASVVLVEDGLKLYSGCCSIQPD